VPALERVIAVSEVRDLLERDVAAVDMRLAARPTVRMTQAAVEDWWRIRQLNAGGQ
jgi:cell division protein FtsQ